MAGSQGKQEGSETRPSNDRLLVKWLEGQSDHLKKQITTEKLEELLGKAAQPRHASGNACIQLCYFIEQCRSSKSSQIQDIALSQKTCLEIFTFYIEWNEKNQNRSMRQVLELLASLIAQNTKKETSNSMKELILLRIISIVTHRAAQPLVKPAFKSLEYFLGKGTISPQDLLDVYETRAISDGSLHDGLAEQYMRWDSLISEVFDWMTLPDVSPAAGKCLVTLFGQLRESIESSLVNYALLWQQWIRLGLNRNPDALENVKNYLFPPLFKLDRSGSLAFLEELNQERPISDFQNQELNAHSLLQLAAMEVGKKAGLIEEPSTIQFQRVTKKSSKFVVLQEKVIGSLLSHASDAVRSLAFSVLVSSASSIRPFSAEALNILRLRIGMLYADTDAKFRNDVLSNTKHMIERMRGATAYLVRELQNLSFLAPARSLRHEDQLQNGAIVELLEQHEAFIQWFLEFLLGELVSTASYQRHITALRAIILLLKSGILEQNAAPVSFPVSGNATFWPYRINFFTSGSLRLLLDLLMDPFEDVRAGALAVLKLASPRDFLLRDRHLQSLAPKLIKSAKLQQNADNVAGDPQDSLHVSTDPEKRQGVNNLDTLADFMARAKELSNRTGRADYADGLARCHQLMYTLLPSAADRLQFVTHLVDDLAAKASIARDNLSKAVLESPIHGVFSALNFVWESVDFLADSRGDTSEDEERIQRRWIVLQERILASCSSIWTTVKDVLCNDSPEGHLPEDLEDVNSIDTKDVLSYSFRAIHESSNLMRTLVSKSRATWSDGELVLPIEVFTDIGNLTFGQLSNLRHRGAFSTVSLTFARCCQLAQSRPPNDLSRVNILEDWYKGSMNCIYAQASTTRRSAGIPALITGILSSNAPNPAFQDVMEELKALAGQPATLSEIDKTNLPQVHALNCLKEIFKSSTLGKRAESHIASCLQLAADSLNSEIWAIRNCGLLLLRSLIDCLFGTSESKTVTEAGWDGRSVRLAYDQYPSLPDLLLKLLKSDTNSNVVINAPVIGAVEPVFPALDILRRAGPPDTRRDEIYTCVSMHLGSKLWHVREIAARTICTLLLHEKWLSVLMELIGSCGRSTNRHHGVLLAVKFILERRLTLDPNYATDGLLEIGSVLKGPKPWRLLNFEPPEILTAHLEVHNVIARIILSGTRDYEYTESLTGQLFPNHALEEFDVLMEVYLKLSNSPHSSDARLNAALGNAIARRGVYTASMNDDVAALQHILKYLAALNTDIILETLECIPHAWENNGSSAARFGISKAYLSLMENNSSPEVRSIALFQLAEALDRQFAQAKPRSKLGAFEHDEIEAFQFDFVALRPLLKNGTESPSLANAKIRISGAVLIREVMSQMFVDNSLKIYRPQLEDWGKLLSMAGEASNDFETRYAAAAALASFYHNLKFNWYISKEECALPSLFALYDSLNDDDDEVRDLSARTASVLLEKSLVPLVAREELLGYIDRLHNRSQSYAWNLFLRLTGFSTYQPLDTQIESAENQFSRAMKDDDSLFVEEEQNLFIDEVRDTKLWCKIFEETDLNSWNEIDIRNIWGRPHSAMAEWVINGLTALNGLLAKEDGPLGWTLKPDVFATCMRILCSANAILRSHEGMLSVTHGHPESRDKIIGDIAGALDRFVALGHKKRVHESLLYEIEGHSRPLANMRRTPETSKSHAF